MSFAKQSPARSRTRLVCEEQGLTEQSYKDECDIHQILRKYEKTGMVTHTAAYAGTYGDFVNSVDFQEAQNVIADAKTMFESVPSKIREQFYNDPAQFLEFIQNDENRAEMEEMGFDTSHLTPLETPVDPIAVKLIPEPNNNNKTASDASEDA